jgi:predicted transposase YbfD/YdcC
MNAAFCCASLGIVPTVRRIPSHDTLTDVFAALDPDLFGECFLAWVEELRDNAPDIVAIDGKTTRGSRDKRKARNPLHLVSAWATRQRIVLGQQATEEKSNEITAIPLLLKHLALKGALVTIDAMGTQTEIAQAIRDGGGDYCLCLKHNWPAVYAEVELLFDDPPEGVAFEVHEEADKNGGGRIERRRHTICHKVDWMASDRHYPGDPIFPGLAAIGRIETEVERNGTIEHQTRYYLLSAKLDAKTFARVVRAHWGVENRLHWVLDVVFREDLKRLRTGHGPRNMAIVRHAAVNLLSRAKPTTSLKNRRKRAGWNTGYLIELLRQTA